MRTATQPTPVAASTRSRTATRPTARLVAGDSTSADAIGSGDGDACGRAAPPPEVGPPLFVAMLPPAMSVGAADASLDPGSEGVGGDPLAEGATGDAENVAVEDEGGGGSLPDVPPETAPATAPVTGADVGGTPRTVEPGCGGRVGPPSYVPEPPLPATWLASCACVLHPVGVTTSFGLQM